MGRSEKGPDSDNRLGNIPTVEIPLNQILNCKLREMGMCKRRKQELERAGVKKIHRRNSME